MTPSIVRAALSWLALALFLGAAGAPAFAEDKKAAKAGTAKHRTTTKFMPGSQETAKERSTRLKRECKGRVNAGACEGYTQ